MMTGLVFVAEVNVDNFLLSWELIELVSTQGWTFSQTSVTTVTRHTVFAAKVESIKRTT